ncbi:MAG: hypothetical protein GX045_08830 [Clostridiaceae bacterium]|nr:hypothetical protein [Clostridiaceae bacterium]
MRIQDFPDEKLDSIISEINYDINLLYVTPCVYIRNQQRRLSGQSQASFHIIDLKIQL